MPASSDAPLILQDHASQGARFLAEMAPDFFRVDERSRADLIAYVARLAEEFAFVSEGENGGVNVGSWAKFYRRDPVILLAEIAAWRNADGFGDMLGQNSQKMRADMVKIRARLEDWQARAGQMTGSIEGGEREERLAKLIGRALDSELQIFAPTERLGTLQTSFSAPPQVYSERADLRDLHSALRRAMGSLSLAAGELLEETLSHKNDHAPQTGLLLAFVDMLERVQSDLNRYTQRHLDYYFQDVLGVRPKPARRDYAALVVKISKDLPRLTLPAGTRFTAGQDDQGREMLFETAYDASLNHGQIGDLATLSRVPNRFAKGAAPWTPKGAFLARPIANSLDGRGAALPPDLGWSPFSTLGDREELDPRFGIGIASPALAFGEGRRALTVTFDFEEARPSLAQRFGDGRNLSTLFRVWVSGEDGFTPVRKPRIRAIGNSLIVRFTLGAGDPPIAPLAAPGWSGADCALRLDLANDPVRTPADALAGLALERVLIKSDVSGVTGLSVTNRDGEVDPSKPFPFLGAEGAKGDFLEAHHGDLTGKTLSDVSLTWRWANRPQPNGRISEHYHGYGKDDLNVTRFRLQAEAGRGGHWRETGQNIAMFTDTPGQWQPANRVTFKLPQSAGAVTDRMRLTLAAPSYGFGQALYPQALAQATLAASKARRRDKPVLPLPPFVPEAEGLALSYAAHDVIPVGDRRAGRLVSFAPFGHHRPLKRGAPAIVLPDEACTLYIGLRDVEAPGALSLLFKIGADRTRGWSAGQDAPEQRLVWRYLSDDRWLPFPEDAVIEDRTKGLMRSGVVRLALPFAMGLGNRTMAGDQRWISVGLSDPAQADRIGKIHLLAPQAITVARLMDQPGAAEALRPMPAGRITAAYGRIAPAIASITQPEHSWGGAAEESAALCQTRTAERLHHRGRALQASDYEALILERFPEIGDAKCLSTTPGEIDIVVSPRRQVGDLRPFVSADRLYVMAEWVAARASVSIDRLTVRTVRFDEVRLMAWLTPDQTLAGGYMREVNVTLQRLIAPWADTPDAPLPMGQGVIDLDALTLELERIPGIRWVAGASLVRFSSLPVEGGGAGTRWYHTVSDTSGHWQAPSVTLAPSGADAVLVPARAHCLRLMTWGNGLGEMEVARDLYIEESPALASPPAPPQAFGEVTEEVPNVKPAPAGIGNFRIGDEFRLQTNPRQFHAASQSRFQSPIFQSSRLPSDPN